MWRCGSREKNKPLDLLWLYTYINLFVDVVGDVGSLKEITSVVSSLRQEVLKGCALVTLGRRAFGRGRIGLSGMTQEAKRHLARCCRALGASLEEPLSHLVAVGRTEQFWTWHRAGGVDIVHPGWLLYAYVTWERPCEKMLGHLGDLRHELQIVLL